MTSRKKSFTRRRRNRLTQDMNTGQFWKSCGSNEYLLNPLRRNEQEREKDDKFALDTQQQLMARTVNWPRLPKGSPRVKTRRTKNFTRLPL